MFLMESLSGNAVVAQSGGPTAVSNASACGIIQEALPLTAVVRELLGANNGLLGIVQEDLFDLRAESADTIEQLCCTPSALIGSCRYPLGDAAAGQARYQRLLEVLRAHDVRFFFFIGGNESMAAAAHLHQLAASAGYELRVVGVPKTVHNDLVRTDHCPGFGSAAKYLATSVMEVGRDNEAMYTFEPVTIVEVMGRDTGWLAAATGLARRHEEDAPHLIYVPEIPFSVERFLQEVSEVHRRLGRCVVVVSEGLVDAHGRYVAGQVDALGHREPGEVGHHLRRLIVQEIGIQCRYNKLDTCQRNAVHFASRTDSDEAYLCGREAVRQALAGVSGQMIVLQRTGDHPYRCTTGLAPLDKVAGSIKRLPREYLDVAGTAITPAMRAHVSPLVVGEVALRMGTDGLPEFARLRRRPVSKRLPAFSSKTT